MQAIGPLINPPRRFPALISGTAGESAHSRVGAARLDGPAALRSADGDPTTAGRALGVRYLLEGTLGRRDSVVRLVLRLVSVEDGFQRWAEELRFPPGIALEMQDSIVRRVARALGERLTALEATALSPRLTSHPGAYDRFLRPTSS